MKRFVPLTILMFALFFAYGQVPQKFSYQAVATDDAGTELPNRLLHVKASIVSGTPSGTVQYIERHLMATDEFGLFTVDIGAGIYEGGILTQFSQIDWGSDLYFLRIEMDASGTGGIDFVPVGVKPLLSVPYALYTENANRANQATLADSASVAHTAFDDNDKDAQNEIQDLQLNGTELQLTNSSAPPIDLSTLNVNDADADPSNEIQELTLNGNEIQLTNSQGPPIDLSNLVNDADADPTNEIQSLQLTGNELSLTGSQDPPVDLGNLNVEDADADPTNEIQSLQLTGNELSLTGSQDPPIDLGNLNVEDADADPTNEIQSLQLTGNELSLTGSQDPPIDLGNLNVEDADADPSNEIQNLFINGDTLGISGGNMLLLSNALSGAGGFNDPGATIDYPQGVTDATYIFRPDNYTVPPGKVFYIVAAEDELILPGVGNNFGRHLTGPNMPLFDEGVEIDNCRCIGFLKDKKAEVNPDIVVLQANQGNAFSVPSNKNFVLKSGLDATTPVTLNNMTVNFFSGTIKALVIPGGIEVRNNGNDEIILTGYMIENQ